MPRRAKVTKREVVPDSKYNNKTMGRMINKLMIGGKKGTAESVLYGAMDLIGERSGRDPLEVFEQGLRNATPVIEVKPRRVGGATYQVPVEIKGDRRHSLAIRWLLAAAHNRSGRSMAEKLAGEIMDASNGTGATVKKKEDTHRMADANKAFAHYRW